MGTQLSCISTGNKARDKEKDNRFKESSTTAGQPSAKENTGGDGKTQATPLGGRMDDDKRTPGQNGSTKKQNKGDEENVRFQKLSADVKANHLASTQYRAVDENNSNQFTTEGD